MVPSTRTTCQLLGEQNIVVVIISIIENGLTVGEQSFS